MKKKDQKTPFYLFLFDRMFKIFDTLCILAVFQNKFFELFFINWF